MLGAVVAGWMGWAVAFDGFGDLSDVKRAIIAAMFAAFGLLLAAAGISHAVALFDRRPLLVLDEAGVLDRRLTARPVPYGDVQALLPVLTGRDYLLVLHSDTPRAYGLPVHPLWRVNALAGRLLGRPALGVKLQGLDTDVMALVAAIEAQAAAHLTPERAGSAETGAVADGDDHRDEP